MPRSFVKALVRSSAVEDVTGERVADDSLPLYRDRFVYSLLQNAVCARYNGARRIRAVKEANYNGLLHREVNLPVLIEQLGDSVPVLYAPTKRMKAAMTHARAKIGPMDLVHQLNGENTRRTIMTLSLQQRLPDSVWRNTSCYQMRVYQIQLDELKNLMLLDGGPVAFAYEDVIGCLGMD